MRNFLAFILMMLTWFCFGQNKEGAWWILYNKLRVNFNTQPPTIDTLANFTSSLQTYTLSDSNGTLLLYGNPPMDKNNTTLPNSNAIPNNLGINSLLIVKKPYSTNYGVFANASINSGLTAGIFYYELDNNLQVITGSFQQVALSPSIFFRNSAPSAFLHQNNNDYWIVFHSQVGNTFISIPYTSNGIGNPLYYSSGALLKNTSNANFNQSFLKSSPKSNMMCIAKLNGNVGDSSYFEIYEFNRQTGIPQNLFYQKSFGFGDEIPTKNVFSPSERFIYQISLYSISQLDLTSKNQVLINSSRFVIDTLPKFSPCYGDGSIAIDGKVYISSTQGFANVNMGFSVINCPDELCPNCGFEKNKYLTPADPREFLPFQNQTFFRNADSLQAQADGPNKICVGDTTLLSAYGAGADSFYWFPQAGLDNPHSNRPRAFPTQTTTYYAVGYKQCGAPDTAYVTITVYPKIKPQLTASNTTFCAGDSATISLNNPSLFDSVFWSNGSKNSAVIYPKSSGKFFAAAIDTNGCRTLNSDTVTTKQNPPPPKPIISTSPNDTICFGDTAKLSVANVQSGWRIQWSSGDTVASVTAKSNANFTAVVTDTNNCQNTADTIRFRLNALPLKPLVSITPNDSVCFGDTAMINVLNRQSDWAYFWNTGDTSAGFLIAQSSNLIVENTDSNGCKNRSDTLRFTVLPLPQKPSLSVLPNDTICYGDVATVAKNVSPNLSHEWLLNGASKGQSQTLQTDSAANVVLVVTDAFGCQNHSDTLQILLEVPAPPIAFQGTDTFCRGDSLVLSVACCPTVEGYNYLWSNGSSSNAITITENGSYSVQITNITNCKSPVSQTVFVAVNDIPAVDIQTQDSVLCLGEKTTLSVITDTKNPTITWSNASQNESIVVAEPANYAVTITDQNNCSNTTSKLVRKGLETACSFSPNPITGFAPLTVQLTNSSSNATLFSWDFGNGVTSSESSPTIVYEIGGDYSIALRCESVDGCVDSARYQFIKVNDELTVYIPNSFSPNGDGVNDFFEVFTKGAASLKMKVFNRIGEKVFESENDQLKWDGYYKGVLQEAGNYVYQIQVFSKYKTVKTYKGTVTIIR